MKGPSVTINDHTMNISQEMIIIPPIFSSSREKIREAIFRLQFKIFLERSSEANKAMSVRVETAAITTSC